MSSDLQASAKQSATTDRDFGRQVRAKYGSFFALYRGPIPLSLCIAHTANVNRTLDDAPIPGRDYRRGFCKANTGTADGAGISLASLDDPRTAAYVWCKEVNQESSSLYTQNASLFTSFSDDFWRTVYLKHRLGDYAFDQVWSQANPMVGGVYEGLIYVVNTMQKGLIPWSATQLKYLVFFDCEYVYWLGTQTGRWLSDTYGVAPALSRADAMNTKVGGQ